jgi:hypothetical protein
VKSPIENNRNIGFFSVMPSGRPLSSLYLFLRPMPIMISPSLSEAIPVGLSPVKKVSMLSLDFKDDDYTDGKKCAPKSLGESRRLVCRLS